MKNSYKYCPEDPMKLAIKLAEFACSKGEIPVGCVLIDKNKKLVSYASNLKEYSFDPTGHAEIIAIRKACKKLKTTKLTGFSIYVTLEPCQMCQALIISTGIKNVFFGAHSENLIIHKNKIKNYFNNKKNYEYLGGFNEDYCSELIIKSFKKKR